MSADAIRSYVETLRDGRGITQNTLANNIGMHWRTYVAWATGNTEDIKAPYLLKAIDILGGSPDHLVRLSRDDATEQMGVQLARAVLGGMATEGTVAYTQTPVDVRQLMNYFDEELSALREEERSKLISALRGFIAGFRAGWK